MNLPTRSIELANEYFAKLKGQFPEIELVGLRPNVDSPEDVWLDLVFPESEERREMLDDFAVKLGVEYLDKHHILFTHMHAIPTD